MSIKQNKLVTGFTIVELIVVIVIIGILSTIVGLSYKNWQTSIVTAQLKSDLNGVASAMENARTFGNSYPSSVPTTFEASEGVTLTGGSSADGKTYCVSAVSSRDESIRYYIDSLSGADGAKQGICGSLNLIATTVSMTEIDVSWDAFVGATSYTLQRDTSPSFSPNPTIVTQTGITYLSSGLSQGIKYYYRVNATNVNGASSWSTTANATTTIDAPSAPTVTANTVAATTTWSWTAPSCASGTTARYQYKYTITPSGYDSGWVAPTNPETLSIGFTTSTENQTYTVQVQTQCYTANTASTWSASGQASYFRPITTYTLTIIAGTGGTVNAGGTYNTGTVQTITATPSTYYSFTSWTGSTGCSGVASHTITMDANKSCTANFTPTAIAAPATPGVTANTAGATTTWSWTTPSCASGTTARYQYKYTITPSGYDSGWVAIASSPVAFTTSTGGQTYTVQVQAQCYNAVTISGWSASGSANYYRPTYTLTTIAGTGGTVSAGGTYNFGSTPTITATPNSYYTFTSWTGSTGCSGVASHTITMNADKSCTASFVLDSNWLAVGTQVWAKANLNVGTMVTGVTNQTNNSILEKYCYSDTESNCTTYGGLYQWNEAMQYVTTQGAQGICPAGSHIPSDNDWKILEMQLGMTQAQADAAASYRGTDQGTQLKPGGTSGLNIPLAGYRYDPSGSFSGLSTAADWWSSSESSASAWIRNLSSGLATVFRNPNTKGMGMSVRCLKN